MTQNAYVEPVPYGPESVIDVTVALWIPCTHQLTPEEWTRLAMVYPELGRLPVDAHFRRMQLLIKPPEVCDQEGLTKVLAWVAEIRQEHFLVIQECFVSDAVPMQWVVVCRRSESVGHLTMNIYRLGQP